MKILFLDESGDHNLTLVDNDYPVFVLAGVIVCEEYYEKVLKPAVSHFKGKLFGGDKVVLHYRDYTRNRNGFEKMISSDFRKQFYDSLNNLIAESEITLLASVLDKKKHIKKYSVLAVDPYILSLEIIVERFVFLLQETNENGVIIAESRGNQLDNELQLAFLNLKIKGTRFLRPIQISNTIKNLVFKKKEENDAGLQLADTLVTPIGRKYLKKVNYYLNYDKIKEKYRKNNCGKYLGYGLVVLLGNKNG